jgi:hypothetical protein
MMKSISTLLGDLLIQTFLIFIVIGCIVSLLVGLWMLMKPDTTLRLNQYFNRWFATDKLTAVFNSRHNVENVLHRHHRLVGALVLIGAMYYLLYGLLFAFRSKDLTAVLFQSASAPVTGWLATAVVYVLGVGNVLAVVVGIGLLLRPNLLARFEAWANKLVGSDKLQQVLDAMYMQPDVLIVRHIRLVGFLIVGGSIYALASFGIAL